MYWPSHFDWSERASILAFCRSHSFATVVAAGADGPEAQHIPLLVEEEAGAVVLRGHVAAANPLARAERALAVFTGPHAYVSAAWYGEPDTVPTWNYLAVHAGGPLTAIADPQEVRACFDRLAAADPERAAWQRGLGGETYARLAAAVRWFRIAVTRLEGKAKLSQNHQPERRRRAIERLRSGDEAARGTAAAMTRVLDGQPPWPAGG